MRSSLVWLANVTERKQAVPPTCRSWSAPDAVGKVIVVSSITYDLFPVSGPLQAVDPDFFLLAGTGTREGE